MPKLGVNLVLQGKLNKNIYTITTNNNIFIKRNNQTLIKGYKSNNIYYFTCRIIKTNRTEQNKEQILYSNNDLIH